jgi:hypothetical protein
MHPTATVASTASSRVSFSSRLPRNYGLSHEVLRYTELLDEWESPRGLVKVAVGRA